MKILAIGVGIYKLPKDTIKKTYLIAKSFHKSSQPLVIKVATFYPTNVLVHPNASFHKGR